MDQEDDRHPYDKPNFEDISVEDAIWEMKHKMEQKALAGAETLDNPTSLDYDDPYKSVTDAITDALGYLEQLETRWVTICERYNVSMEDGSHISLHIGFIRRELEEVI